MTYKLLALVTIVACGVSACRQDEPKDIPIESKPLPQSVEQAEQATTPPPQVAPVEIDVAQDAPETPGWLPRPRDIVGWQRTGNSTRIDVSRWSDAPAGLPEVSAAYNTRSALELRYASKSPGPTGVDARLILVETASPEDAYGMLTAMVQTIPDRAVGTLSATLSEGKRYERFCWQGLYYAHVVATGASNQTAQAAVDRLIAAVVEPVPSADLPTLLAYMPIKNRMPGRTWIIRRSLGVLPEEFQSEVLNRATRETGEALGFSPETLTAIVAYEPGDDETPNYVWLTQYPTAGHAAQAMARYKNILRVIKPAPQVMMPTPTGRYLCGTWTAGQESIPTMMILPQIQDKLPKE